MSSIVCVYVDERSIANLHASFYSILSRCARSSSFIAFARARALAAIRFLAAASSSRQRARAHTHTSKYEHRSYRRRYRETRKRVAYARALVYSLARSPASGRLLTHRRPAPRNARVRARATERDRWPPPLRTGSGRQRLSARLRLATARTLICAAHHLSTYNARIDAIANKQRSIV